MPSRPYAKDERKPPTEFFPAGHLEDFIHSLASLGGLWIYVAIFLIAYIENLFPPSPSDMVVVFGGSLAGIGRIDFLGVLAAATLGSTLGFATMYAVGRWFGVRIIEGGKLSFIPKESVTKVEGWFRKYGYWIIVLNRFLAGTRAVVSFFAGISRLRLPQTTFLCFISSLAWNSILVTAGNFLGQNWQDIGIYLTTYSQTVTAVIILVVLLLVARYVFGRKKNKSSN